LRFTLLADENAAGLRSAAYREITVTRHQALMAGKGRTGGKQLALLDLQDFGIEIPGHRQPDGSFGFGLSGDGARRHRGFLKHSTERITN
jgi:hypothetical protein